MTASWDLDTAFALCVVVVVVVVVWICCNASKNCVSLSVSGLKAVSLSASGLKAISLFRSGLNIGTDLKVAGSCAEVVLIVVPTVVGGRVKAGTDRTFVLPKFVAPSWEMSWLLMGRPTRSDSSLMSLLYCEMSFCSICFVRSTSAGLSLVCDWFSLRIPLIKLMFSWASEICWTMTAGDCVATTAESIWFFGADWLSTLLPVRFSANSRIRLASAERSVVKLMMFEYCRWNCERICNQQLFFLNWWKLKKIDKSFKALTFQQVSKL